jgi:hypothetical protein
MLYPGDGTFATAIGIDESVVLVQSIDIFMLMLRFDYLAAHPAICLRIARGLSTPPSRRGLNSIKIYSKRLLTQLRRRYAHAGRWNALQINQDLISSRHFVNKGGLHPSHYFLVRIVAEQISLKIYSSVTASLDLPQKLFRDRLSLTLAVTAMTFLAFV